MLPDYATDAAIVGVPQAAEVKYVELGGRYVTNVVGAVPVIVVLGLEVAVPPEILADVPAPELPSLTQVVTKVSTVLDVAVAVVRMYSPEYGAVALFNWNIVVGLAVRLYHPVVVAKVVCVPPLPPILVVPV
jgi:hypothetical protein